MQPQEKQLHPSEKLQVEQERLEQQERQPSQHNHLQKEEHIPIYIKYKLHLIDSYIYATSTHFQQIKNHNSQKPNN